MKKEKAKLNKDTELCCRQMGRDIPSSSMTVSAAGYTLKAPVISQFRLGSLDFGDVEAVGVFDDRSDLSDGGGPERLLNLFQPIGAALDG